MLVKENFDMNCTHGATVANDKYRHLLERGISLSLWDIELELESIQEELPGLREEARRLLKYIKEAPEETSVYETDRYKKLCQLGMFLADREKTLLARADAPPVPVQEEIDDEKALTPEELYNKAHWGGSIHSWERIADWLYAKGDKLPASYTAFMLDRIDEARLRREIPLRQYAIIGLFLTYKLGWEKEGLRFVSLHKKLSESSKQALESDSEPCSEFSQERHYLTEDELIHCIEMRASF